VKPEAVKIRGWLEEGKVKPTGKVDREGLFTFSDFRGDYEQLTSFDNYQMKNKRPNWLAIMCRAGNKFRLLNTRHK
jgi:hypothetical protein